MPLTWDPSAKYIDMILTNGNLTCDSSGGLSAGAPFIFANRSTSAKQYWEVSINTSGDQHWFDVGICPKAGVDGETFIDGPGVAIEMASETSWSIFNNGAGVNSGAASSGNHILNIAHDTISNKVYFGVDGVWVNGGDPSAGTGGITPTNPGPYFPAADFINGTSDPAGYVMTVNFGTTAFTYAIPTGYNTSILQKQYFLR